MWFVSSGFFADDKSTEQAEFLKAASALRDDYRFAHTNAEALLNSHGGEWVRPSAFERKLGQNEELLRLKIKAQIYFSENLEFSLWIEIVQTTYQHTADAEKPFPFLSAGESYCSVRHVSTTSLKTARWNSARTSSPATRSKDSSRTTCEFSPRHQSTKRLPAGGQHGDVGLWRPQ